MHSEEIYERSSPPPKEKLINNLTFEISSQNLTMENSNLMSALEVSEGLRVDVFHFFHTL